jgi:hypothetical protein
VEELDDNRAGRGVPHPTPAALPPQNPAPPDNPSKPSTFRTSDQYEIDLVLGVDGELWAIEVELTASPGPDDMNRLDKTAELIGASRRYLVSQTRRTSGDKLRSSCNLPGLIRWLHDLKGRDRAGSRRTSVDKLKPRRSTG